jgi:hypothetical protein
MKTVKLIKDIDGNKYAFCPYCNEFAYEKDHCVFCGKKYKLVERKERSVSVGEYTAVQTSNNHVIIHNGERMVMHIECNRRMSKRALKKQIAFYEFMTEERNIT